MSNPLTLPVLISGMPYVQEIVSVEAARPEVNAMLYGPLLTEQIRQNARNVQEVEHGEAVDPLKDESKEQQRRRRQEHQERKKKEEPEEQPASASPWAGNILNLRV